MRALVGGDAATQKNKGGSGERSAIKNAIKKQDDLTAACRFEALGHLKTSTLTGLVA